MATPIAAERAPPSLDENGKAVREAGGFGMARVDEGFLQRYVAAMPPVGFIQNLGTEWRRRTSFWSGKMTLRVNGRHATYCAGGRSDVPPGTVHSAGIGGLLLVDWGALKKGERWCYRAAGLSCGARARSSSSTT